MEQPPDWWAAVDAAASKAKISRAEWLWHAARSQLPTRIAAKLAERPPAHRPRKPK
jgi:hypothetical protein